jgi:hypothetical protein
MGIKSLGVMTLWTSMSSLSMMMGAAESMAL